MNSSRISTSPRKTTSPDSSVSQGTGKVDLKKRDVITRSQGCPASPNMPKRKRSTSALNSSTAKSTTRTINAIQQRGVSKSVRVSVHHGHSCSTTSITCRLWKVISSVTSRTTASISDTTILLVIRADMTLTTSRKSTTLP